MKMIGRTLDSSNRSTSFYINCTLRYEFMNFVFSFSYLIFRVNVRLAFLRRISSAPNTQTRTQREWIDGLCTGSRNVRAGLK